MSSRKAIDAAQARAMGARIREMRGSESQADFADALGIDRTSLANYEAGRRVPNDIILKRIGVLKQVLPSEILFGSQSDPFIDKISRINKRIEIEMRERPGIIARFTFSDDEIALIMVFRMAASAGDALAPLAALVECAEDVVRVGRDKSDAIYGEEHVRRLRAALKRGSLEEGYDPEAALFDVLKDR